MSAERLLGPGRSNSGAFEEKFVLPKHPNNLSPTQRLVKTAKYVSIAVLASALLYVIIALVLRYCIRVGDHMVDWASRLLWCCIQGSVSYKSRRWMTNKFLGVWVLTKFHHPQMLRLWYWLSDTSSNGTGTPWLEAWKDGWKYKAQLDSELTFTQFSKKMAVKCVHSMVMRDWINTQCPTGDLREFFDLMDEDKKGKICMSHFLSLWDKTRKPLRIFVLGAVGQGKSTLINSLFYCWKEEAGSQVCKQATAGGAAQAVTSQLGMYTLPSALFEFPEDGEFNCVEIGDLPGANLNEQDMMSIGQGLDTFRGQWHLGCVCDAKYDIRFGSNLQISANVFCMAFETSISDHVILISTKGDQVPQIQGMDHKMMTKEQLDAESEKKIQRLSDQLRKKLGSKGEIMKKVSVSNCDKPCTYDAELAHQPPNLDELVAEINTCLKSMKFEQIATQAVVRNPKKAPFQDDVIKSLIRRNNMFAGLLGVALVVFIFAFYFLNKKAAQVQCGFAQENVGNMFFPVCTASKCHLPNTVGDGAACACAPGYTGKISWPGPVGTCEISICNADNSNKEPGPACACAEGYEGTVQWISGLPISHCTYKCKQWEKYVDGECRSQPPCGGIAHVDGDGIHSDCRCKDGFHATKPLRWHNGRMDSKCEAVECTIPGSNKQPGPACACDAGLFGSITWNEDLATGSCAENCEGPGYYHHFVDGVDICVAKPCNSTMVANVVGEGTGCKCAEGFKMTKQLKWHGTGATQDLDGHCEAVEPQPCRSWEKGTRRFWDGQWMGQCTPADCDVEFGNGVIGEGCRCADAFSGVVNWKNAPANGVPSGICKPAVCKVDGETNGKNGNECKCHYGGDDITWIRDQPSGSCNGVIGYAVSYLWPLIVALFCFFFLVMLLLGMVAVGLLAVGAIFG